MATPVSSQNPPPYAQDEPTSDTLPGPIPSPDDEHLTDGTCILLNEIREWHLHIYFHLSSDPEEHPHAEQLEAIKLRDAVLSLRDQGVFTVIPLARVNTAPIGPHPAGSYELWVPSSSFLTLFSFFTLNRGSLSILVHPLTRHERADHEARRVWMGPSWPLDLSVLPVESPGVPYQWEQLQLGYSEPSWQDDVLKGTAEREQKGKALRKLVETLEGAS
ncbi:DOPA-like domain-containing protein [Phlyctochytrium arcticum]|nr:DOPA-like domain-containing protein [Phlyctochytrium arcticum]